MNFGGLEDIKRLMPLIKILLAEIELISNKAKFPVGFKPSVSHSAS